jgi:hypothetical protein
VKSKALEPIEQAPEKSLDVESKFGRIVYPRPAAKIEPEMSQSAIALAAQNSPGVESDQKPILTIADAWNNAEFGEVLHAAEPSGQLNLLEWDVIEPPEPDDFDQMTDFHAAYDRWLLSSELHEIIHQNDATIARTDTRCDRASEVCGDNSAATKRDLCPEYDGASLCDSFSRNE